MDILYINCTLTINVRLKAKKEAIESGKIIKVKIFNRKDSIAMESIAHNKRYLPHELKTRVHSVELYRKTKDINFVCRRYHISKASLMRWNKRYDGSWKSLRNHSRRPHSRRPNAHTDEELRWIQNLHRRNPNISINEMYGKLLEKGYKWHPGSLCRVFVRLKKQSLQRKSQSI